MLDQKILKVSSKSSVPQLAGSIIKSIDGGNEVELRAVGASAVNQMYKSLASARGIIASRGKDLLIKPGFDEIIEDDSKKTVMVARLVIK